MPSDGTEDYCFECASSRAMCFCDGTYPEERPDANLKSEERMSEFGNERGIFNDILADPPTEQERCRWCNGTGKPKPGSPAAARGRSCSRCAGSGDDPPAEQDVSRYPEKWDDPPAEPDDAKYASEARVKVLPNYDESMLRVRQERDDAERERDTALATLRELVEGIDLELDLSDDYSVMQAEPGELIALRRPKEVWESFEKRVAKARALLPKGA